MSLEETTHIELHDATLVSVDFRWLDGQVALLFRAQLGAMTVTAHNVTSLVVPRENPWGPSVSVNSTRVLNGTGSSLRRLVIEMQSGDEIVIDAERFEIGSED